MAITSATTCCAFLSTCFSPIASTRSFGIFAALVVFWDYLLVMSLFCTAVVIYHNRFDRESCCRLNMCRCCGCCTKGCKVNLQSPTPTEKIMLTIDEGKELEPDAVTKFFGTTFTDFILAPNSRKGIGLGFVCLLIPMFIYVGKLEPTRTAEQFLAEDHPLQYSITILNNEFPVSSEDEGLLVYFNWGIGPVDRAGVNQLADPTFLGTPSFKDFSLTPTCQAKLLEACEDVELDTSQARLDLIKRADSGLGSIRCVMRSLLTFANATSIDTADVNSVVEAYMADPEDETFASLLGWTGSELKYVTLEIEAQGLDQWATKPEAYVRDIYEEFMALADHLDGIVGDACGEPGVLMTDQAQKFIFMNNQKIYRTSAVGGACIGVVLAFGVLLIATQSVRLATFSAMSIFFTMMTVIGSVTMLGWTLGTVEAILISILAGFSVDYVVHLVHSYATSTGTNHQRVRHAFGEMGTPVLSGMLTSVLASLPLFTCQIVFFAKFGFFLCFTILWSWTFANFAFMSTLATVGGNP
jgi:hypothetical protein